MWWGLIIMDPKDFLLPMNTSHLYHFYYSCVKGWSHHVNTGNNHNYRAHRITSGVKGWKYRLIRYEERLKLREIRSCSTAGLAYFGGQGKQDGPKRSILWKLSWQHITTHINEFKMELCSGFYLTLIFYTCRGWTGLRVFEIQSSN